MERSMKDSKQAAATTWGLGAVIVVAMLMTACGGYKSDFSCKGYPDVALCKSVSDVYNDRFEPSQKVVQKNGDSDHSRGAKPEPDVPAVGAFAGRAESFIGKPIIKPAKSLRIWIAPWKDAKKRLHEATLVYQVVEEADFVYGHSTSGKGITTSGRTREFLPRAAKMVEPRDPNKKSASGNAAIRNMLPENGVHDDGHAPAQSSMLPTLPQGLPQMPQAPQNGGRPNLMDDGPLPYQ